MTRAGDGPARRTVLAGAAAALAAMAGPGGGAAGAAPSTGLPGLAGWRADNLDDLAAILAAISAATGSARLADAAGAADLRRFLEETAEPLLVGDPEECLLTGYYEPVLAARSAPDRTFRTPLLAPPPDLAPGPAAPTRAQIGAGALTGRGLELYWLADPVDLFFLQVQGSGRLILPDGRLVRIGYAARNGHPYVSIGRLLVERGVFAPGSLTADLLKDWLRADPDRAARLMAENPSYVFFRELRGHPPELGPIGAMGLPLTPWRSLAVDPAFHPYGSLLWVERWGESVGRLMVAMDTGSAIRGPQRGDIFCGTGPEAGITAGALVSRGRILRLTPRESAG